MDRHSPASTLGSNILWLVALAVFLFVPAYFFVFGKHQPFSPNWFTDKAERTRYAIIGKRMFVWFITAGVVGSIWSLLLGYVFT
jgi:hypothetical protein